MSRKVPPLAPSLIVLTLPFRTTPQVPPKPNRRFSTHFQPSSLDDIEDIEQYRTGGFHPVHIGDVFAEERYRVIHKLGYGGFSTVWLARDDHRHRYVALKILVAEASKDCSELSILDHLRTCSVDHPGRKHVASILESFDLKGPNGTHLCLVAPVAGPTVAQLAYSPGQVAGSRRLRARIARKAAWQAAQALSYLHGRGIVHGDFTCTNILFQLRDFDTWSEKQIYERLGNPVKAIVKAASGETSGSSAPTYLVQPCAMAELDPRWMSEDILVIDFGQSFFSTQPPSKGVGTPLAYCAPELIFDDEASVRSDIWALGCTIFEIRAGAGLFMSFFGGPDEILRQMVQTLGRLPDRWWSRWENRKQFFNESGKPKEAWPNDTPLAVEYPLREVIQDIGAEDECAENEDCVARDQEASTNLMEPKGTRASDAEIDCMENLLSSILRYNPAQRSPVEVIAQHRWFTMTD